jgi:hypothetical protein
VPLASVVLVVTDSVSDEVRVSELTVELMGAVFVAEMLAALLFALSGPALQALMATTPASKVIVHRFFRIYPFLSGDSSKLSWISKV